MDSSTRQRALEAAAKVAIAFSAFGCGTTGLDSVATTGHYTDAPAASVQGGATAAAQDSGGSLQSEAGGEVVAEASTGDEVVVDASTGDELVVEASADAYDAPAMRDSASEAQMLTCDALLSRRMPDGSFSLTKADQDDPEVQACCAEIEAPRPGSGGPGGRGTLSLACCEIPMIANAFGACTPWGPPVPPAMPSAWSDAWEVT